MEIHLFQGTKLIIEVIVKGKIVTILEEKILFFESGRRKKENGSL